MKRWDKAPEIVAILPQGRIPSKRLHKLIYIKQTFLTLPPLCGLRTLPLLSQEAGELLRSFSQGCFRGRCRVQRQDHISGPERTSSGCNLDSDSYTFGLGRCAKGDPRVFTRLIMPFLIVYGLDPDVSDIFRLSFAPQGCQELTEFRVEVPGPHLRARLGST